jgi:hypothetical protein
MKLKKILFRRVSWIGNMSYHWAKLECGHEIQDKNPNQKRAKCKVCKDETTNKEVKP